MNELCFVWGAPLSGQRSWMLRAARETGAGVDVDILALDALSDEANWPGVLARLETALAEQSPNPRHIYCEIPWAAVEDGLTLEEWIETRPEFRMPGASWSLNFVGLCPPAAGRLPEDFRVGYEEFSRGAHSVIIVPRVGGESGNPEWVEKSQLDFGRRVEVYEEELFSQDSFERIVAGGESDVVVDAGEMASLTTLSFLVEGDRTRYMEMLQDLREGIYGDIWGAEILWREEGKAGVATTLLVLSQAKLFMAQSTHPSLESVALPGRALLQVAGSITNAAGLLASLRSTGDA